MFNLAMVQMKVIAGDKASNLARAENLIKRASSHGAACVLFPEAMDVGWTHPSSLEEADAIPHGEACQRLSAAAQKQGMYVCAGLVERDGEHVYNSAVIIDSDGDVILKHRKLNELQIAHPYYRQGDRLGVCHTPLGTLGLMICADGLTRDRVLARALGYMGADVILSPSAWAVDCHHDQAKQPYGETWRNAYVPVAREFAVWIAGTSNVGWITGGPWQGKMCIGCSLVVDPGGNIVLQGSYGVEAEEVLYVDIEPEKRPARGTAWFKHWSELELAD